MFNRSFVCRTVVQAVVGLSLVLAANIATAQTVGPGISVVGQSKSEQTAELLRMSVKLEAQGATVEEALERLAKKKKQATIQLEKLEAIEDSIKLSEVSAGGQADTSAMKRQMKQMMGDDPRIAKMMAIKPPVKLTVTATADWQLESDVEADELFVVVDQLKQKITDAKLGGGDAADELSEEQQEIAEEMAALMSRYGMQDNNGTPAGTQTFRFVRRVSSEDHQKTLADAFAKAKNQAERIAAAAGLELGAPVTITTAATSTNQAMAQMIAYRRYNGGESQMPSVNELTEGAIEVLGNSPLKVTHGVSVSVVYAIK